MSRHSDTGAEHSCNIPNPAPVDPQGPPQTPSSHQRQWIVRPYRAGDEVGAVELFERAFGRPITVEHYCWKLLAQPVPYSTVWLAVLDGRVIGQYAGTPIRFKLGDRIVQALHSCDVMTAPEFRKQGVLTALGSAANADWAAAGASFTTGLHYGGWGSRRGFLGWREMFKLVWLHRPIAFDRMISRRIRLPSTALSALHLASLGWNRVFGWRSNGPMSPVLEVSEVSHAGPEFDELWAALSSTYESLVVRDSVWVSYRYLRAPSRDYTVLLATCRDRPVGYIVYRLSRGNKHVERSGRGPVKASRTIGWIPDLFVAPDDTRTRRVLLGEAIARLMASGADEVRMLVSRGTSFHRELRRFGFLYERGTFEASIVALDRAAPLFRLSRPDRWFTMGGDYDVI